MIDLFLITTLAFSCYLPMVTNEYPDDQADIVFLDCLPGEDVHVGWYFDLPKGERASMRVLWIFVEVETGEAHWIWRPYEIIGPGILREIVSTKDTHFIAEAAWISTYPAQVLWAYCETSR